jgi:cell division protein FtsB
VTALSTATLVISVAVFVFTVWSGRRTKGQALEALRNAQLAEQHAASAEQNAQLAEERAALVQDLVRRDRGDGPPG